MDDLDLVAPDVVQLIHLFTAQSDLRFPDLDAAVLQEALLLVRERHRDLLRAEAALAVTRSALEDEQEVLLKKSHRAHAYLRVFAENDAALLEQVQAIALPKLRRTTRSEVPAPVDGAAAEVRKRGRPKKAQPAAESLFDSQEVSESTSPS